MKKFCVLPLLAALAVFVSCQKQQTEEERKAEVEKQVQERLAAQKLDDERERLAKQKAELDAREKALANQQPVAVMTPASAQEEPMQVEETPPAEQRREVTETTETRTEERSTESYGMFYEKLDPYGEWRETNDYGYVWQPREAESSRDWRPYTEGRWAYSDAGWTWISDEKFGWATYHYGRWVKLRRIGWVWVPGDEWAPAWVSWRTSKDYVGWAPLPPEARFDRRTGIHNWADNYYDIGPDQYAFVPSNEFGAEHVRRAVVPAERNITIVVDTTNVTRITFSNTTIMNEGPSYEELRSRSQRPIERYRLRRQRNMETQARVSGGELEVSVPLLTDVRNVVRPRRVKERVVDMNVDNGWTEIKDRSAAERARTKIRTESTPPPNAPPKKFVKPVERTTASATPAAPTTPAATTTPPAPTSPATTPTSPTPVTAKPSPSVAKASPTPSAAPAASPTVQAASPTPAMSPTPRVRPSASIGPRPSPSVAASPVATPAVATTPAAPALASPTIAPTTPAAPSVAPSPKVRPSPSIRPRPVQTPAPSLPRTTPAVTVPPVTAPETPIVKPSVTMPPTRRPSVAPRLTPPPAMTPAVTVPPVTAPEPATTPVVRPTVTIPPSRRPSVAPRLTPPPETTPATTPAPSVPPATNERPNNRRRPMPPVPGASPTTSPSAAPE